MLLASVKWEARANILDFFEAMETLRKFVDDPIYCYVGKTDRVTELLHALMLMEDELRMLCGRGAEIEAHAACPMAEVINLFHLSPLWGKVETNRGTRSQDNSPSVGCCGLLTLSKPTSGCWKLLQNILPYHRGTRRRSVC